MPNIKNKTTMNAAAVACQMTRMITLTDARLRRGLISPEEHLITVGEVMRWAAWATKQYPEDENENENED